MVSEKGKREKKDRRAKVKGSKRIGKEEGRPRRRGKRERKKTRVKKR